MKIALQMLSPKGKNGRLSILIFHRVLPEIDPLFPAEIHAARFEKICCWLRQWFCVIPLHEGVRRLRDGTLPARALAITFDDGYADNHDIALPILMKHQLPATFFIATGFMEGGCMWNDVVIEAIRRSRHSKITLEGLLPGEHALVTTTDRRVLMSRLVPLLKHLPLADRLHWAGTVALACGVSPNAALMMSPAQVRTLHQNGMEIGAHTVNHPILAVLGDDAAHCEIAESKIYLESLIDAPVPLFAYPNGRPGSDYSSRSVHLVRRCGFEAAVSTSWGAARRGADLFQLPRFTPWDFSRMRFGLRMANNLLRQKHEDVTDG